MTRIPSGVTDQYIYFIAVDSTDFVTRETGLTTFTVYRSRNGGTATVFTTPTVAELSAGNMPGVYSLLLDEDMTIDSGDDTQEMAFHITQASMAPVTRTIELFRPKITAGETLVLSSGVLGTGVIAAASLAADTITAAKIADGAIDAATFAAGAINAAAIAADAIGASELAADAATEIADALLDRSAGIETNRTLRQGLRLMLSAMVGKASGLSGTTATYRDTNDGINRIVATVDSSGNRSAVTLDSS